ncbi:glycosyl transferase GT-A type structural fold protein [Metarhizium robertsii]|uniref:Glycosyl transferase GT-A type structural fold protein n=1 Tax=Metarhizium robertsii TaxID=568076 RepID=A0A014QQ00_9HYPO|nr:glycosyl transferase GT-A type structural fold protein [Metarhizium robertsii]
MVADGMTKALPKVRHIEFLRQLRIEDIRSRIGTGAKLEEARSQLQERLQNPDKEKDLELKLVNNESHNVTRNILNHHYFPELDQGTQSTPQKHNFPQCLPSSVMVPFQMGRHAMRLSLIPLKNA